MSTSFISHRSQDGSRAFAVLSLTALRSITPAQVNALHQIGIRSLSDLLHYDPIHRARLVEAVAQHRIAHDFDLRTILRDSAAQKSPEELLESSTEIIDGVGDATAILLRDALGIQTVAQLANFLPFVEAEALMRSQADTFSEALSAPDDLIPVATATVSSTHRYSSFVRDRVIPLKGINLISRLQGHSDERLAKSFAPLERNELAVGYMLRHTQEWINLGSRLGEVIHSLGLAPGESRNVSVIDWKRSLLARRDEDTTAREQLNSLLVHTRALDEVTRATAEEHQSGRTSTASASGVTAGGAVAAGSMIGAIGGAVVGGATGAIAGLTLDTATLGLDLGTGTIAGTIVGSLAGSAVGAAAGGVAGSLIFSGAGALGFIESDSKGDRSVGGELSQNIMDVTAQKSSHIRSLRSTIVVADIQTEQAAATTYNVTNYNHAHALTVQYYELLQRYRVRLTTDAVEPFVIIPFSPLPFNLKLISDYWSILRRGVPPAMREPIDTMYEEVGSIEKPLEPVSVDEDAELRRIQISATFEILAAGKIPIASLRLTGGSRKLDNVQTGSASITGQQTFSSNRPKLRNIYSIRIEGGWCRLCIDISIEVRKRRSN